MPQKINVHKKALVLNSDFLIGLCICVMGEWVAVIRWKGPVKLSLPT